MIVKSNGRVLKAHLLGYTCLQEESSDHPRYYVDYVCRTTCLHCLNQRANDKNLTRSARRYAKHRAKNVVNYNAYIKAQSFS